MPNVKPQRLLITVAFRLRDCKGNAVSPANFIMAIMSNNSVHIRLRKRTYSGPGKLYPNKTSAHLQSDEINLKLIKDVFWACVSQVTRCPTSMMPKRNTVYGTKHKQNIDTQKTVLANISKRQKF